MWLGSIVVRDLDLAISRLRVQLPAAELLGSNPRQIAHMHVQSH